MCDKFIIHVNVNELCIQNVSDDVAQKDIQIHVGLINAKVEKNVGGVLTFKDGCQNVDLKFSLQADDAVDNDDFIFTTLGSSLNVNLSIEMEAPKKRRTVGSNLNSQVTCGEINMLHELQKFLNSPNKSFVMRIIDNMEIAITYEISFENIPSIASTLLIEIIDFHNMDVDQNYSTIEACIRFPHNESFRAGIMRRSDRFSANNEFLLDEHLIASQVDVFTKKLSKVKLEYENYQSEIGVKFFHQLIANKQNFLVELKVGEKMMMAFIDLDIFNHPGVHEMIFVTQLFDWNKRIIRDLFQQEASMTEQNPGKTKKKLSIKKKSMEISEGDLILKPILSEEKNAAISIKIKFSSPISQAESLDHLTWQLNDKFHFKSDEPESEQIIRECHEIFKSTIEEIASKVEKCMHENPGMSEKEYRVMIDELYDKNELKEVITNLIGNIYNRETRTETNHEFKLLMIKIFKSLNRKMMEILKNKWKNDENPKMSSMGEKVRRCQIDEWILLKNPGKAQDILDELNDLEELAFYHFKMHKFDKCEETIFKILENDSRNKLALYLLTSLMITRCDIKSAILCLKILITIQADNFEFWMLLSSLYEEIKLTCGVKFAKVKLKLSKYIPIYDLNESPLYPKITSDDPLVNIFQQQLHFGAIQFLEMTKKFIGSFDNFENKILCAMEAFEKCEFDEASTALKSIIIADENEAAIRILRGNVLYATDNEWHAVCEYEIAYNLYLKASNKFPQLPALRCAQWYLHEIKNSTKARRYFHYCCKNFSTFNSWNGLGIVNFMEASYKNAESCFNNANQIHRNCGENWLNLSLVNCKLGHLDIALECYMTARNCGINDDSEVLNDVEKALEI